MQLELLLLNSCCIAYTAQKAFRQLEFHGARFVRDASFRFAVQVERSRKQLY